MIHSLCDYFQILTEKMGEVRTGKLREGAIDTEALISIGTRKLNCCVNNIVVFFVRLRSLELRICEVLKHNS